MKKILCAFFLVVLSACSSDNVLSQMRFQTNPTDPYILSSWHKITEPGKTLKVYIEGDGNAFNALGYPTSNPTPRSTFLRKIVAGDTSPNVVYLGRPCQYITPPSCQEKDWTTGRFSEQVIESTEKAINALMKKAKAKEVILIGYSGGATVAGLVAVRNPDKVKGVITIAGVLDHQVWTQYHRDLPLSDSLNLADYKQEFNKIPQHHFVGEKDKVVPSQLIFDFVQDKERITVLKEATHNSGFESIYRDLYNTY